MKYPYIGKGTESGTIELIYSKGLGVAMDSKTWAAGNGDDKEVEESFFKNITAEYLANTYGEVKSKEHAEFIKLLAETNKIPCAVLSIDMNYTMFYVIDGCLFFCVKEIDAIGDYNKITIPLPPELNVNTPEEDFKMKQIAKNNDTQPSHVTFNTPENLNLSFTTTETISTSGARQLDITVIDNNAYTYNNLIQDSERVRKVAEIINKSEKAARMQKVNKAASDALKESGDNLDECASEILDVLYSDLSSEEKHNKQLEILAKYIVKECESRITGEPEEDAGMNLIFGDSDKCKEWPCVGSKVTWGNKSVSGEVKAISEGLAWIKNEYGNHCTEYLSALSKPKTPEEELRDDIIEIIESSPSSDYAMDVIAEKYNITKKPQ